MRRQSQSASSSSAKASTGIGGKRNLKKNQACLPCRRGKMKCDAAQPHCTNCVKAWEALLAAPPVPGFIPPDGPGCYYDPVEGLVFTPEIIADPSIRAKVIEEQLAQLQKTLEEAREQTGQKRPSTSSSSGSSSKKQRVGASDENRPSLNSTTSNTISNNSESSSTANLLAPPPNPFFRNLSRPISNNPAATQSESLNAVELPEHELLLQLVDTFLSNEPHASRILHVPTLYAALRLFPNRSESNREHAPHSHQNTPSRALLHAICASAARYYAPPSSSNSPHHDIPEINVGSSTLQPTPFRQQRGSTWPSPLSSASNSPGPQSRPTSKALPDHFAADHASRARQLINSSILEHEHLGIPATKPASRSTGRRRSASSSHSDGFRSGGGTPPLAEPDEEPDAVENRTTKEALIFKEVMQPLLVLTTFYYHEAKSMEAWTNIGSLTRVAISLGLHHPPKPPSLSGAPPRRTIIENEERRRAFWSTFVLDRLISAGGWSHSVFELDSIANFKGQFPIMSSREFKDLGAAPASGLPPHIRTFHTPLPALDSFSLLIETATTLGRVTEYNVRRRIQSSRSSNLNRAPGTLFRSSYSSGDSSSDSEASPSDPMSKWDFRELDSILGGENGMPLGKSDPFSLGSLGSGRSMRGLPWTNSGGKSLPVKFRTPIAVMDSLIPGEDVPPLDCGPGYEALGTIGGGGILDTDLYLAHVIGHTAMILLHFPHATFGTERASGSPASTGNSSGFNFPTELTHLAPDVAGSAATAPSITLTPGFPSSIFTSDFSANWFLGESLGQDDFPSLTSGPPSGRPSSMESLAPGGQRPGSSSSSETNNNLLRPRTADSSTHSRSRLESNTHSNPTPSPSSSLNLSARRCLKAAKAIGESLRLIGATTFDISKLHPFVTTCWYVAAVVLVHERKRVMTSGADMEILMSSSTGDSEINMFREALSKYGSRSPIGAHHERQLQNVISPVIGDGITSISPDSLQLHITRSPLPYHSSLPGSSSMSSAPTFNTNIASEQHHQILFQDTLFAPAPSRQMTIPIFPFDNSSMEQAPDGSQGHASSYSSPGGAAVAPLPAIGFGA